MGIEHLFHPLALAKQKIARSLMASSYDRRGGNHDWSNYLRTEGRAAVPAARIRTLSFVVFAAFAGIGVKLLNLGLSHDPPQTLKADADGAISGARPDLLDRNGEILETDVKTMSAFAEPNRIIDKDEAVELITAVLPDVDAKELLFHGREARGPCLP